MEKLYSRKTDGKMFRMEYKKPFLLNNEIKETGSKFGICFDIYVFQADDGEIEIEMYPKFKEIFDEIEEETIINNSLLKQIENFLDNNEYLKITIAFDKTTLSSDNVITIYHPLFIHSISVNYNNIITIIYQNSNNRHKTMINITTNDKEHKHILELFNEKYREIMQSARI